MSKKYRSVFVEYDELGEGSMTADSVIEEEPRDTFTGLYDSRGHEVHRHVERVPMGYHAIKLRAQ